MLPGTSEVNLAASAPRSYLSMRSAATKSGVLMAAYTLADVPKNWQSEGNAKLRFDCVEGQCTLRDIWSGADSSVFHFNTPKPGRDGDIHITEITMTRAKAD